MFKLDKYIIRSFLITFFYIILILVVVVTVIDFVEKNSDWIEHDLSVWFVLKNFYIYYIPYMVNMISPLMVFISVVYVMARMASHSEIVAMLAAGISFRRILAPIMAGAVFLGLLTFLLTGWVIPLANKPRLAFEAEYNYEPTYFDDYNYHLRTDENIYAYLESYNNTVEEGYKFTLETIEGQKLKSKLSARRIRWSKEREVWELHDWVWHTFDGMEETIRRGKVRDTSINMYPSDFGSQRKRYETFTIPELQATIDEMRLRGLPGVEMYVVDYYTRFAYPVAVVILAIMGAIVAGRKSREGTGLQIALGFILAFLFIIFVIIGRSLGKSGTLHPLIGAWLPILVFSLVTLYLFRRVPK